MYYHFAIISSPGSLARVRPHPPRLFPSQRHPHERLRHPRHGGQPGVRGAVPRALR